VKKAKKKKYVNPRFPSHQVKLPRENMPLHPALAAVSLLQRHKGLSVRQVAIQILGCAQQSLDKIVQAARANRDFHLSPERCIALAKASGIAPYYFNPVIWPNPKWRA
jgi:hypothetical protein